MTMIFGKTIPSLALAGALALLAGCGGGSDSGQENTPGTPPDSGSGGDQLVYNGPTAATDDVLQFKLNIWDNLAADDRCGGCHNEEVGQEPIFMRRDDINLAYELTLPLVDKAAPVLSRLVERAAEGHNAWDPSAADTIQNLIQRWATNTGAAENVIVLTAPEVREIGETRQFPVTSDLYAATIWPLVRDAGAANCMACHAEDTAERQQPFFASGNPDTAYFAARTLIDLNNPSASRFIQRMQENHNTWADPAGVLPQQAYSVQEMTRVINDFVGQVELVEVDPALLVSNAVGIVDDGVVASAGGRVETDVIALYQFKQGAGSVAYDTSGVEPALNLNLSPSVEWVGSWGIRIEDNGKAQGDTISSKKLNDLIKLTGEFSIESWVIPGNVTQEESRIITYSGGTNARNFSLNQTLYDYDFLMRTENSDANGMPLLNTPSADEVLQSTLQHVVATYDPIEGRKIYVNGELIVEDASNEFAGSINDWDDTFVLAVGNEVDNAQWWEGTMRLLAIHNRVLTDEQVFANFEAGVGQKYFLLFGVSHLVDMPEAYVVFSVEVYDDYSYLFEAPFFISLDRDAVPAGDIDISGIRIGINGKESPISQAFANIDMTINADNYDGALGVPLSPNPNGTLIGLENGPLNDLFFLTFDGIGGNTFARPADPDGVPADPVIAATQPELGMRLFDEIFSNMAAITTVPAASIYDFYVDEIRRSLPSAESADGFLASQQSAITQLSLAYCTELVSNAALRNSFFGDYGDLSTQAMRDALINPLLARMLVADDGSLAAHPSASDVRLRLDNDVPEPPPGSGAGLGPADYPGLLQRMAGNADTKATAVCTSVLASAAMLMQ